MSISGQQCQFYIQTRFDGAQANFGDDSVKGVSTDKESYAINLEDYDYKSHLDMQISEAEEALSKKQADLSGAVAKFEDY